MDTERPDPILPPEVLDATMVRWRLPAVDRSLALRMWLEPSTRVWEVIQEMMADARVAQAVRLVKSAVVALGYTVEGESEIAEFVDWNLTSQEGPISQVMHHILSAYEWGYSITWLDWGPGEGRWDGKWVVRRIVPLPPIRYLPVPDDSGRIVGVEDRATGKRYGKADLSRFIIMRWNTALGSPYGVSQLYAAREAWYNKSILKRYRNMALERFGSPFVVVRVPRGVPEERRIQILETVIKNFSSQGGAVLNDDERLELIKDAGAGGAAEFQRAVDSENQEIMAAIAGASLHLDRGSGGSYAQAKVHQEMFLYIVQDLASTLEAALNEQLVSRLVRWNYGEGDARIRWNNAIDNAKEVLSMVQTLVPMGIVDANEPWIRERLGLPERQVEEQPPVVPKPWWEEGEHG